MSGDVSANVRPSEEMARVANPKPHGTEGDVRPSNEAVAERLTMMANIQAVRIDSSSAGGLNIGL